VEPNQINVLALAVLRDFEEIEDAKKTRGQRELRSDIGETDRLDGIDFDLAFVHRVAPADFHVRPRPYADAARDFSPTNSIT